MAAPRKVVRRAVLTAARKKRAQGKTGADYSRKEALRTVRQVVRDVKANPKPVRLASEFKRPIKQTQGKQELRKVKKALRTIKRKSS